MIFTNSKSIFQTVSIAKNLARGRVGRDLGTKDTTEEKDAGLVPIAAHESNKLA